MHAVDQNIPCDQVMDGDMDPGVLRNADHRSGDLQLFAVLSESENLQAWPRFVFRIKCAFADLKFDRERRPRTKFPPHADSCSLQCVATRDLRGRLPRSVRQRKTLARRRSGSAPGLRRYTAWFSRKKRLSLRFLPSSTTNLGRGFLRRPFSARYTPCIAFGLLPIGSYP